MELALASSAFCISSLKIEVPSGYNSKSSRIRDVKLTVCPKSCHSIVSKLDQGKVIVNEIHGLNE